MGNASSDGIFIDKEGKGDQDRSPPTETINRKVKSKRSSFALKEVFVSFQRMADVRNPDFKIESCFHSQKIIPLNK